MNTNSVEENNDTTKNIDESHFTNELEKSNKDDKKEVKSKKMEPINIQRIFNINA